MVEIFTFLSKSNGQGISIAVAQLTRTRCGAKEAKTTPPPTKNNNNSIINRWGWG